MKKFLEYKLELVGTNENDVTDELVKRLDSDYEKGLGIYNLIFGNVEVGAHAERNTLVLYGELIADTKKECKSLYGLLKIEAKKTFSKCTKTQDMMVMEGDRLY